MNKLMMFENNEVEVFELEGKVLFNPYHVGRCLDMGDSAIRMNIKDMDEDEVVKLSNSSIVSLNDFRKLHNTGENFLTEMGVYTLIMKSRKPEAIKFQKWVTKVVLPSIRKNGGYIANQENMTNEEILANAILVADKVIREKDLLIREQQELIEEQAPTVEFYDDVTGSADTIDMAEVAKILNIKGVGRNTLFEILRDNKILMKNNQSYQTYVDKGWFRLVESSYIKPNGDVCINIKTVVFQKGVEGISGLLKNLGY